MNDIFKFLGFLVVSELLLLLLFLPGIILVNFFESLITIPFIELFYFLYFGLAISPMIYILAYFILKFKNLFNFSNG